ncbi:MAG TPA: hypothetical protein DCP91_02590 [Eggerthellaceae bacterium]|nr:hypothetical protein [Eggerthellaceae bacterium]
MNTGVTYIEINYDANWVNNAISNLSGFSWLFEWGMYIFLIATLAILIWIFFDSITKKKDQKALVPRILAIVGFFATIPAFIFRFTGNADGVTNLVKLNAETGTPYYPGPINWNVNWLVSGYGTAIAIITLVGMVISIVALVIYASSVQRAKPPTEFVNAFDKRMSSLEQEVEKARRSATAASENASVKAGSASSLANVARSGSAPSGSSSTATIIDRKPQAATVIDIPSTGDTVTVHSGNDRGRVFDLPARDMTVGRDASADIVVDDLKVSREHARLTYSGGAWSVLDLGSSNGTYLNGQRVAGQQQVANGDKIKLGDTTLVFGTSR